MICGIYKITNKINGHCYIGQSVDIKARFRQHLFSAKHINNKDHSSPIHLALSKYGKDEFDWEILEECTKEELDEKEIYWISFYNSTKNGNYNILSGGQDRYSFEGKAVELYDLNGQYVITIPSATEVAEYLKVSRNSVYGVLHGERPTCKEFQMKYVEDKKIKIKPFVSKQGGCKKINQLNKETKEIIKTFNSAAEAARETGADSSTIIKVCKGKLKSTKGFCWEYFNEDRVKHT